MAGAVAIVPWLKLGWRRPKWPNPNGPWRHVTAVGGLAEAEAKAFCSWVADELYSPWAHCVRVRWLWRMPFAGLKDTAVQCLGEPLKRRFCTERGGYNAEKSFGEVREELK